ncbi:MAG: FHA domain-containing protein [Planctomyces sp.]
MSIRIVMHDSKEYSFDRDIVRIGKSSRSDIVLAGDGILQEHAELQRIGGRWLNNRSGDQTLTV